MEKGEREKEKSDNRGRKKEKRVTTEGGRKKNSDNRGREEEK